MNLKFRKADIPYREAEQFVSFTSYLNTTGQYI